MQIFLSGSKKERLGKCPAPGTIKKCDQYNSCYKTTHQLLHTCCLQRSNLIAPSSRHLCNSLVTSYIHDTDKTCSSTADNALQHDWLYWDMSTSHNLQLICFLSL